MPWWLRRVENRSGEWSVTDLRLGYRICAYHESGHGGTHLHAPPDGWAEGRVDLRSAAEALRAVRAYAEEHDAFTPGRFREFLKPWRSESKRP